MSTYNYIIKVKNKNQSTCNLTTVMLNDTPHATIVYSTLSSEIQVNQEAARGILKRNGREQKKLTDLFSVCIIRCRQGQFITLLLFFI